ncbi:hypothetical protein FPANT_9167 [Fusarium pseudoanthophilum]|uniref:Uncharacterized protein n=1 Tax=Fusarium pseudoanthophilum TaxID=48495 RepID=A0A8H5NZ32_9HYPO|nr:hypothetical protein FPANT_9167 [Fusarium pseudoanthophilum]
MSQSVGFSWTTPQSLIKSFREQSPRSKYINDLVERIKSETGSGSTVSLQEILENYIHPLNMDLALTTINLLRFPFNTTTPPGNDHNNVRYRRTITLTESWNIAEYITEVLSNGKRLHEFLELADQVNQLAFIFASVSHAEYYWFKMYYLYTTANTEDVVLFLVNMIRRRMLQAINRNPPGTQPTDLDGNPIEPNLFARVQQAFWLHELKLRARILEEGWRTNQIQIPGDENPADIVETLQRPHDIDVRRFLELVEWQRFEGTFFDHGIEDREKLRVLNERLLGCSTPENLGIQGSALCLPRSDDKYSMQLLFQLAALDEQSGLFWERYDFQSAFWYDGWFEKYPVSGSIEHFSLGIDYSRLERERDHQQE